MNRMLTIEFRASSYPWNDFIAILVCQRDHATGRIGFHAKPVAFTMEKYEPGSMVTEPTIQLTPEEARNLMDALWNAGVRPTDFKNQNGEINRLDAHLQDMRRLVFDVSAAPSTKAHQ